MAARRCWLLALAWLGWLAAGLPALAQEYQGKYLYNETDAKDAGGIRLRLAEGSVRPQVVVAVGRRKHNVYRAKLGADGREAVFAHLPADIYDLLVATDRDFFEGVRLVRENDAAAVERERAAVTDEVMKIEGFFDGKRIQRLELEGEQAVVLLQQWRIKEAVKQSGAPVTGCIHSLDVIWFERPAKGWQLLLRRQVYREELKNREPLTHHQVPELGNVRVSTAEVVVGPVKVAQ